LTSKHDGSRKASMLDDDASYSFSKVHCGGEMRRAVAITASFDADTLRFKGIMGEPRIVEIVANEELDCGIVRSMEEGNFILDETNAQCAVRVELVDKLYKANRDRIGDENEFFLHPEKSKTHQRIADTQFAREVTGRDEYLFRSVINSGGTTMSEWTRHVFKVIRFVFSTGLRTQIIRNWGLDIEFGSPQFQGAAFKQALQPLIQFLETRVSANTNEHSQQQLYVPTAAPLWEKFKSGSQDARSPVALELLASSLIKVESAELLDLIAAASAVLIDVDTSTPCLRILDGLTSIEQTMPQIQQVGATSGPQSRNQIAGTLFANWRDGGGGGDVGNKNDDDNSSSNNNSPTNLESAQGAKPPRVFIGPFDVTNETEYTSLLYGTSPLRNGMHTLAHYLALRPPRSEADRVKLKKTIENMRDDIIAAQDQRRKDSISNTLSCLFDPQVPVGVKKVMLAGHVSRTTEYYKESNLVNVYLPKWSCFVAANIIRPRGAKPEDDNIPMLSKCQILACVEEAPSTASSSLTSDELTNSIPPLDLGDNNVTMGLRSPTNSPMNQGGSLGGGGVPPRGWRFQAMRAPGGGTIKKAEGSGDEEVVVIKGPVWYKATTGQIISFSLYVDERQAWKITFPVLLGGTIVAGRGHDTALLDKL
jgi:hypothetical protein